MLTQLNIRNYAIVEQLDLELHNGMTVVSGETGAGKSIMLDALGLALGNRADSGTVRNGAERAEITADFDISNIPAARDWLITEELNQDDQCILRRVVTAEGRSRCYINGTACPIAKVRQLGEYLIEIHGQHEHQRLLKKDHHRHLLDAFSGEARLVQQVRQQHKNGAYWTRNTKPYPSKTKSKPPGYSCSAIRLKNWKPCKLRKANSNRW
ncbi:AAA family ATPase [Aliamphritea spongicola]|nr:AAA family ATPase [Aliamphritea spongicola]